MAVQWAHAPLMRVFLRSTASVAAPPQPGCAARVPAGSGRAGSVAATFSVARPMLVSRNMSPAPKARFLTAVRKPILVLSAALALMFTLTAAPAEAQARGYWRHHGWFGFHGGFRGWFFGPPIWFGYHYETPPPPPPPVYAYPSYPSYPYAQPPPPVQVPAQPVPAPAPYVYAQRDPVNIGFHLSGLVETPHYGDLPMGGVDAALQFRTGSHSLMSLELQSLGAHRLSDDLRRNDLRGLVSGRLFLWNAGLAPYLELAGGLGHASVESNALPRIEATQMVARVGVGLEVRLGEHVVLDGQVAQSHALTFDDGVDSFDPHERATQVRGGVTLRF